MKRPQTEFHAHSMRESQVIRSKKVNLSLGQNLFIGKTFCRIVFSPKHRYFIETTTTDIDAFARLVAIL